MESQASTSTSSEGSGRQRDGVEQLVEEALRTCQRFIDDRKLGGRISHLDPLKKHCTPENVYRCFLGLCHVLGHEVLGMTGGALSVPDMGVFYRRGEPGTAVELIFDRGSFSEDLFVFSSEQTDWKTLLRSCQPIKKFHLEKVRTFLCPAEVIEDFAKVAMPALLRALSWVCREKAPIHVELGPLGVISSDVGRALTFTPRKPGTSKNPHPFLGGTRADRSPLRREQAKIASLGINPFAGKTLLETLDSDEEAAAGGAPKPPPGRTPSSPTSSSDDVLGDDPLLRSSYGPLFSSAGRSTSSSARLREIYDEARFQDAQASRTRTSHHDTSQAAMFPELINRYSRTRLAPLRADMDETFFTGKGRGVDTSAPSFGEGASGRL